MTPMPDAESAIHTFESACAERWPVDFEPFLPPTTDPARTHLLCELVRVELELSYARGTPKSAASYRVAYPELFGRRELADAIEFEESRLRSNLLSATAVPGTQSPDEGESADWEDVASAGTVVVAGISQLAADQDTPPPRSPVNVRVGDLPEAGDEFLGFKLTEELGTGAFGRVFLAQQSSLSDRPVALKITARPSREAQCLARFQHANIVPVLSVHQDGNLQAVCMPYYGRTTLGRVIGLLNKQKARPASGLELLSTIRAGHDETVTSSPGAGPRSASAPFEPAAPIRAMLARLSYADAVVWTVARLAEGLAHAHDRGVLHRDLKPDNVLITDEGQPMLLDFNLAEDAANDDSKKGRGGTVYYMAPEHVAAFRGDRTKVVDARSDLYALGIIAYELLAGEHPFPVPKGEADLLLAMQHQRERPARPVRSVNPAVPTTVESILVKLLDPDPARRYQSARELADDLDRHNQDRPLAHARESVRRRCVKWARRNRRVLPLAGLAATTLLTVAVGMAAARNQRFRDQVVAVAAQERFHDEVRGAAVFINQGADPHSQALAAGRLSQALAHYRGDPADNGLVTRLDPDRRERLQGDLGEALFLLARAGRGDPARSLELNKQAEAAFGPEVPPAVYRQRAELARRLGESGLLEKMRSDSVRRPNRTAREFYLAGVDLSATGEFAAAAVDLEQACRLEPGHYAALFALGCCYESLDRLPEALECFRACVALDPSRPSPHLKRGQIHAKQHKLGDAAWDLDRAVALDPAWGDAHFARGTLYLLERQYANAVEAFDRAEANGTNRARLYLLRADARDKLKDHAGAALDRKAGLDMRAADELDHLFRGAALTPGDPDLALDEYEAALELNPRSVTAWQNKASLLSEQLDRPAEALLALDRVLALAPEFVPARVGRAVLLARAGRRAEAHADAAEALKRDSRPVTLYQAACVHALTARTAPGDADEAMRLLAAAFTAGYDDFATVTHDPDLAAVRPLPAFAHLTKEFRDRARKR